MKPLTQHSKELLERLASEAEDGLLLASEYLQERGIDPDTATSHRLGVVLDQSSKYAGMLSIPSLGYDLDGIERVRGIKYRRLDDGEPKYLCTDGYGSRLFNPRALHRIDVSDIHVTEGELDCIILSQCGYAAVGVPGSTQWSGERAQRWATMLGGYDRVFVWGDKDPAGEEFVKNVRGSLSQTIGVSLSVVEAEKADVTDAYLQGGAELIKELIENA